MTEKQYELIKCNNNEWGVSDDNLIDSDNPILTTIDKTGCKIIVDKLNNQKIKIKELLNENNQLELKLERYEMIMGEYDISDFDELKTIIEQGIGV